MRICHVIDYFHTDVGYQEFFLAREQASAGHAVRVISSAFRQHTVAEPGPDEARGLAELHEAGVEVIRLPARQLGHDRTWLRGLDAAITAHSADVAHVHGPFCPTTVRAVRACGRAGVPVLVDNHIQEAIAPASTSTLGRLSYAAYRMAFGRVLRRDVGAWVANGPHEADFLATRLGIARSQVELIPLAFDPASFHYDDEHRAALRAEAGWLDDDLVVTVTGKLHAGKRVEAVTAAAEVVASGRAIRVVVAGSLPDGYEDVIRGVAPELDAVGRIEIRPLLSQRQLADLYLAADVVVFARLPSISIYEASGTGARVLVGDDDFARWLHLMTDIIEPVAVTDIASHLVEAHDRPARAEAAAKALGWPAVSATFVDRYRQLACAS
jgi:glycosyltransferase involved in cell wall biosynthesis